jgi:hypothetical protein
MQLTNPRSSVTTTNNLIKSKSPPLSPFGPLSVERMLYAKSPRTYFFIEKKRVQIDFQLIPILFFLVIFVI